MAVLQIFDKLLQFPLFQGMSRDDLEIVAGHIRFGFLKLNAGKTVVKSGDTCHQLYFLINGLMLNILPAVQLPASICISIGNLMQRQL